MNTLPLFITALSIVTGIFPCPDNCHCHGNILRCHRNTAPNSIPKAITEVYLNGFHLVPTNVFPFQHQSWHSVLMLDIIVNYPTDILYLADGIFRGLHNLTYLGFHGITGADPLKPQTFRTSRGSLRGIEHVKTLNFSGNEAVALDSVINMIEPNNVVPKLENLILTRLYSLVSTLIDFNKHVFEALKRKPIKTLVLDHTSLNMDFNGLSLICSKVETISLRSTTMMRMKGLWDFRCKSLQFLDLTNANIPFLQFALTIKHFTQEMFQADNFNGRLGFLFTTKKLYLNHVSLQPVRFEGGLKFNATGVILKTQNLQFRSNVFQWFNTTITNLDLLPNTEFDFSYNELGYIHPRCIDPGNNLVKLDLSHNKLFIMETKFSNDFAIFLSVFHDLEDINLSSNNLSKIPTQMFAANTKLQNIDLSKNNLKTFSFNISKLNNLEYINLAGNKISNIDLPKTNMINNFIIKYNQGHHNKTSKINLGRNDFVCSCEDNTFMKWVKDSDFLVEKNNDLYLCKFEDEHFNMKTDALTKTINICDNRKTVQVAIIASISVFVCLIIFIIVIIIMRKKLIKQAIISKGINQIKRGQLGDNFLVFLSYSSDDGDFALEHVYPQLNDELCFLTGVRNVYVCDGERNFRPGFPIISEIMGYLSKSAVVVCLVSRSFCEKGWCKTEIEEALTQRKPIILLFTEDVQETMMPPVMKKIFHRNIRSKVTIGDDGKCVTNPSWPVLCSSILQLAALTLHDIETSPEHDISVISLDPLLRT